MNLANAKSLCAVGALLGSIALLIAAYWCLSRIIFLTNATSSSATIVAVSYEPVPKGKGSMLAYVPTVRIQDAQGTPVDVKVDTFSKDPIYVVGQKMSVTCNATRGCVEDKFFAKWGAPLFDLLIAMFFFLPLLALKFELWQPNGEIVVLSLRRDV